MRVRNLFLIAILVIVLAGGALAPARAQGGNGITAPAAGQTVSGSVQIVGTATLPDFLRYELYFSTNEQDWVYFAGGPAPVIGGVLGYWDTVGANLPDGRYSLRMRVVKADSNYDEYYVRGLIVANSAPPTVAASPTPLEQPDTPTPRPTNATPSAGSTVTVTVELPPTRVVATPTATRRPGARATSTNLIDLPQLSTSGLGDAFLRGVGITVVVFLFVGSYTFLRDGTRWVFRQVRRAIYRRRHRGGR